ncbi:MAG: phosphoadenosine phosphosulfate reductase family protein, partial [Bacteroidota bacterium]|nr:phosphoadenosine phosphosulfate reductase family protein [Bacteroidota bacterium]
MSLLKRFINYIREQNLFQKKDYLLLAVSGGVDSVVLCELCKKAEFQFKIAHCNFQLRGEESERDEQFVRSLGDKYDVKVFVKKFDTKEYAEKNKTSIQVAARELRYVWFEELMKEDDRQQAADNQELTSYLIPHTSYL